MKLFHSPASPYVRKVMVFAHRLGLADRIEIVPATPGPVKRDAQIVARNPLGKVPTLLTDDGLALYDSRVICEYLNDLAGGSLYPAGAGRWAVLAEHALYDGMLDAALLARYETALRPQAQQWADWSHGQFDKIWTGLNEAESKAAGLAGRFDLATITLACLLGYLDLRFADTDWRAKCPQLAAWFKAFDSLPGLVETRPPR